MPPRTGIPLSLIFFGKGQTIDFPKPQDCREIRNKVINKLG